MFLKTLLKQNPRLIDVEQTEANACQLLKTASHYNIKLYFMSKQFGHNPELCRRLLACRYEGINNKIARFSGVWQRWILKKRANYTDTQFP